MTDGTRLPEPAFASDPTFIALLDQLQSRLNNRVCCTLVYGSCLRSGDIYDGLVDLYLLVDSYRDAYSQRRLAAANWLLPPNVFYAQQQSANDSAPGPVLRSKVTVISLRDFESGCSTAWFQSYIWGRFAQPTLVLRPRDRAIADRVDTALSTAAATLLRRGAVQSPSEGDVLSLWEDALTLSYATELRTERAGRTRELVQSAADYYHTMASQSADIAGLTLQESPEGVALRYRHSFTPWQRRRNALAWFARRLQGKTLSVARLVKALFTFEGGLDYIVWKLERHSGEKIEIPTRVRQRPLIHLWAFFWGLYRRGIFK